MQYNNWSNISNNVIQITTFQLYAPVVTLSINDNIKFLENIKQGFKRTVPSNKYISEKRAQTKSNNIDYLIDPTFRNMNILFVLSFKNCDDDPKRDSLDVYYMLLSGSKNKEKTYEKLSTCHKMMTVQ